MGGSGQGRWEEVGRADGRKWEEVSRADGRSEVSRADGRKWAVSGREWAGLMGGSEQSVAGSGQG